MERWEKIKRALTHHRQVKGTATPLAGDMLLEFGLGVETEVDPPQKSPKKKSHSIPLKAQGMYDRKQVETDFDPEITTQEHHDSHPAMAAEVTTERDLEPRVKQKPANPRPDKHEVETTQDLTNFNWGD